MKTLVFLCFIFCSRVGLSQSLEETLARQLENREAENENEEDESLEEIYASLLRHPIDINEATATEWNVFPFITPLQIQSLTRYREIFGNLVSVYELQAVPLWNAGDLQKIAPYITVGDAYGILNSKNFWKGTSSLLLRDKLILEKKKGYREKENGYTGSPHHVFFSYRYRFRKWLDVGIRMEKDPGETMFTKQRKTFDFLSFHFYKTGTGFIRRIAMGDFTVNYGQGLIHWQGRSFGKGSIATAVKKEALPVLPYTASNESNFHRGIAVVLAKRKFGGSLFIASQKVSASLQRDSLHVFFSTVNTSGLHRTETELAHRKNLGYTSAGFSVAYHAASCKMGTNFLYHHYSADRQPSAYTYNKYEAKGFGLVNASFDYAFTIQNMHFFGEAAANVAGAGALLAGLLVAADRNLDLSFLYRSVAKDYRAVGAKAFMENSEVENETGFYAGLAFRPSEAWKLEGYADFFRFSWLKYQVDRPSGGRDYLLSLLYKPSKAWEVWGRFKSRQKESNTEQGLPLPAVGDYCRQSFRIYLHNTLTVNSSFKCSAEMVSYREKAKPKEAGFLGFMEMAFRPLPYLSASFRAACFETGGFNSRVYAHESGLPNSSEIPFLDGSGFRYYLNTRLIINKGNTLSFRFSQTLFSDKKEIGTGLEQIRGPRLTMLEMQFQSAF